MNVRLLVWGILFLLAGFAATAYGGWRSYEDLDHWLSARNSLRKVEALSTTDAQESQRNTEDSGNIFDAVEAGLARIPGVSNMIAGQLQNQIDQARDDLAKHLPLALLGLLALYGGNRMLGKANPKHS